MQKLVLIGGGGHCRSCIDVIEATGLFDIVGILDVTKKVGEKVFDYSIVGTDSDTSKFAASGAGFLITLGQVGTGKQRAEIFTKIKAAGGGLVTVISPRAYVSSRARVGEGTIIMHDALVNACASIGANCIINTKALVEHNVQIADHCHISTGAIINGSSKIGAGSFIGSNSTVFNDIAVAKNSIVGAGAVVVKAILKSGIYTGVPARLSK